MALHRNLRKHLFTFSTTSASTVPRITSPLASTLDTSSPQASLPPNAAKFGFLREYLMCSQNRANGSSFISRFLQRNATNRSTVAPSSTTAARFPEFMNLPVGEKLREKLKGMSIVGGDRIRLDGLIPPVKEEEPAGLDSIHGGLTVEDARRILKVSQVERVKARLREVPKISVGYAEYVQMCVEACDQNEEQGLEFAKLLDESGNVIVLGNAVFLRPEQVAKSMETLLSNSLTSPNDPRKKELEQLEKQKTIIDKQAQDQVKRELYCGLGFLTIQTLGFMRLTFWELSWDVMEPICFFVTSLHFALAYGFFLRTSTEPSFEGYFKRRFKSKQMKLMHKYNFDIEKYNRLSQTFYPNYNKQPGYTEFSAIASKYVDEPGAVGAA